eukprot:Nitzschia sp. Nitz4//scaffold98_size77359//9456//10271//NITZ4_005535-RA/size77359-processed-gene-0.30-mRNA-1//-1//CDS//3329560718//6753//frame0
METSKQLVTMMNDEGAKLTIEGSYQEAMKVFTKNLTFVRTLLAEMQSQKPSEQGQCHPSPASGKATTETCTTTSFNHEESATTAVLSGVDVIRASKATMSPDLHQENFVFQHLLLSYHQMRAPDSCFCETMSYTLVFNMAICQHLRLLRQEATTSTTGGMVARDEWWKVLQLYEIAYNLQLSSKVAVPIVFVSAMLTNMTQVHKKLGNEPAYEKCKSTLLSVLMYYAIEVRGNGYLRVDPLAAMMEMYFEDFFATASAIMPAGSFPISAAA